MMKKQSAKRVVLISVIFLLMAFFAVTIVSMVDDSATFDEGNHFASGFYYLRGDKPLFNPDHPPLADVIANSPLLLLFPHIHCPPLPVFSDRRGELLGILFYLSQEILYRTSPGADLFLFWARIPGILLAAVLGLTVFAWAWKIYGRRAGVAALFLFVFSPNIIAHSRLVTNDMGSVVFMVISIFFLWKALGTYKKKYFIFLGIAYGCALASKYTAVIIFPSFLLLGLVAIFWKGGDTAGSPLCPGRKILVVFGGIALAAIISLVVVVLVYKVKYFSIYLHGLSEIIGHYKGEHPSFLMGKYSATGWWHYFAVTFFLKTPPAMLVLLLLTIVFYRRLSPSFFRNEIFLILPVAVYLAAVSASRFNIGHRHILFVYPLLIIFVSKIVYLNSRARKTAPILLGLIFVWYVVSSFSVYPHYLSYFNVLAGGPKNGHKFLSDSNIDWGQDLKRLKAYLDRNGIGDIYLSYFGEADPGYYGINYQWLLPDGPLPERVFSIRPEKKYLAISVKSLQGVSFPDHEVYSWLKRYNHIDRIGYSIYIYDLTGQIDAYLELAYIYFLTGKLDLARRELMDVCRLEPDNPVALKNIDILNELTEKY
jgi:Dolichyl-phosphate-mannose-protein mannosyltransferase